MPEVPEAVPLGPAPTSAVREVQESVLEPPKEEKMNVVAVHKYSGMAREIARRIKNSTDDQALQMAAEEMTAFVPEGAVLVPAPSSTGRNSSMLVLARYIAQIAPGAVAVQAVARTTPLPSKFLLRSAGLPVPDLAAQIASMSPGAEIPKGRPLWAVDNVVATGDTLRAMEIVLGRTLNAIVYADARGIRSTRPNPSGAEMRVCISGSRDYGSLGDVSQILSVLPRKIVVVHGGAHGVDAEAGRVARSLGMEVDVWPAEWEKYGRRAGPIRNRAMVASCGFLYAFWDGISRGTASAIRAALEEDVPFSVVEDSLEV